MSMCSVMSDSLWPPGTVAHQAPLSMGFSRQKYLSGFLFPPSGDLPNPGRESMSPCLLHCRGILDCWTTREVLGSHKKNWIVLEEGTGRWGRTTGQGGGGGYELKEDKKKIKKLGENKNTKDRTETDDIQKNRLWTQQGKETVGRTERIALRHLHHYM